MIVLRKPSNYRSLAGRFWRRKGWCLSFVLSLERGHQFSVPPQLAFVDSVANRLLARSFGAVNRLQCKMIGKPTL